MTTSSYGEPEPFVPAPLTNPSPRNAPRARRRYLPVVAAAGLAIVMFAGGYAVANATAPKVTANGGFARNGAGGPTASGRPAGGSGGGASGTVGTVSANEMTITTAAGGSRIVLLTPTTTVTAVSSTTEAVTDIAAGSQVTVVGTSNPDGSVTATQVIVGNVGGFGRGFGTGAGSSPAPSTGP